MVGTAGDGTGIGLHGHIAGAEDISLAAHVGTVRAVIRRHEVGHVGLQGIAHIVCQEHGIVGSVLFLVEVADPQALGIGLAVHPVNSGTVGSHTRGGKGQHHGIPAAFLAGMASLGEGALITDVVCPEAVGRKEVIAVIQHDIALCHIVLDDVLGLETSGDIFVGIADIEQRVGVLVGNQRGQVQALEADCRSILGHADAVVGLVARTLAVAGPNHHTGLNGVVLGLTGLNQVGSNLILVTAIDVEGVARAEGQVVKFKVEGLGIACGDDHVLAQVGNHRAMVVLVNDEQRCQEVTVILALGVMVGDIDLELDVAVIDDHILIGIQGVDVNGQVHGIDYTAGNVHTARAGDAGTPVVVVGGQIGTLGAGILRGEVEGHDLGASAGNFGLDNRGVLAILVELLIADIQVEFAAVAVGAVVLYRHMALLGSTHLFTTGEFKVGGLEVDNGMIGHRDGVAVDGGLDVVSVTFNHGLPHVAALDTAHGHNLVGAAGDVYAEGIGCRTLGVGPTVGH